MTETPHATRERWISLALILLTLLVYGQVCSHDFINLDDQTYVIENPYVNGGLTIDGIRWAFIGSYASNWHPVTWLSHMTDCELFGLNPGGHHLVNLLFHLANTVLLFRVLTRMTRELWPSALVAALFALHPLHVESVAWVAERKDVLSTFFWMLTFWAYVRYVNRPGTFRYLLALLFFLLGLMSKPMLVTLPFTLLLLDVWPLQRVGSLQSGRGLPVARLFVEKLPFFLCSLGSSVLTLWAQHRGGAVVPVSLVPMSVRIENALSSYASYIGKMFWPSGLAVYYPQSNSWQLWQVLMAGLFLVVVSVLVIQEMQRRPYLAVGWFWYLGTLVPVIGIVQVGGQAMADRYTYVPLIGLFVMIAWGLRDLRMPDKVIKTATTVVLVLCMAGTWLQLRHWQDSVALFRHTLRVTKNNSLAHFNLGCALYAQGREDESIRHLIEALQIEPTYAKAQYNLETILANPTADADPTSKTNLALAHNQLGIGFAQQGNTIKAVSHFSDAARLEPGNAMAHFNLGLALMAEKRRTEAIAEFREALRIQPGLIEARTHLEAALKQEGTGSN